MLSRRSVLSLLAAAPAIAASGCAPEHLPDPIAAWRNPGAGEQDPRRHALAHAILAPNPHNMQPWLVELIGANELALFVDPARLLPQTDPLNRQIVLGCGAFLELFDIAARQSGHRADIALWPEGQPIPVLDARPFARITLTPDANVAPDPLFAAITARRTNREPYDLKRGPAETDLTMIAKAGAAPGLDIAFATDAAKVAALRDIVWRGWQKEMATQAALKESVDVMRIGKAEIAKNRDGIAIDFPILPLLKAMGELTPEKLMDPASNANKEGAKMWGAMAKTAPAFLWIKSADNSRAAQIAAGRGYARVNLAASARGLAMHPWSMALQEYPEMAELYGEQQAMLGANAAAPVQMLVRIGYAKDIAPAPRRGLGAHLKA